MLIIYRNKILKLMSIENMNSFTRIAFTNFFLIKNIENLFCNFRITFFCYILTKRQEWKFYCACTLVQIDCSDCCKTFCFTIKFKLLFISCNMYTLIFFHLFLLIFTANQIIVIILWLYIHSYFHK